MMKKMLAWTAFAFVMLPTSGLLIALMSGVYISREEIGNILLPFYGISILILIFSLPYSKRMD